jgi:hypothetical protein
MSIDSQTSVTQLTAKPGRRWLVIAALAIIGVVSALYPAAALETLSFVAHNLWAMAPIIALAILMSASIRASGADAYLTRLFEGRKITMVLAASAFGAITPICGVGVLPIIAGLLGAGVPLAPIMAFWLSSPITDPAMLTITAATLGVPFAIGKTMIAFAVGLLGGLATLALIARGSFADPLKVGGVDRWTGSQCAAPSDVQWLFWRDDDRRAMFWSDASAAARLVIVWLSVAFAAESLLTRYIPADLVVSLAGSDNMWAIPLAVLVGTPMYIDGYAALPLVRGLIDLGMSEGAAMALLIAGGITSLYASIAVYALVRWQVFAWYLALAVMGSLLAGYAYDLVV